MIQHRPSPFFVSATACRNELSSYEMQDVQLLPTEFLGDFSDLLEAVDV